MIRRFLPSLAFVATLACLPQQVMAQISDTIDAVAGGLPDVGSDFIQIVLTLIAALRPIIALAGVLAIVIAGFRMIIMQEDDAGDKARNVISAAVAGIMLVYLVEPFVQAFYGTSGEVAQGAVESGVAVLSDELYGIISWSLFIAGALAVTMIIVSAVQALVKSGSDEGLAALRKTIFSSAAGILLLAIRAVLVATFGAETGSADPGAIVGFLVNVVNFVLGFMVILAIAALVYAGFQMILSFGKEETFTKAKGLLIRVAIGLAVIVVSWLIVHFVLVTF